MHQFNQIRNVCMETKYDYKVYVIGNIVNLLNLFNVMVLWIFILFSEKEQNHLKNFFSAKKYYFFSVKF